MSEIKSKKIDIWYEATNVNKSVYDKEKALLNHYLYRNNDDSKYQQKESIQAVFEAWEDQPSRFFLFEYANESYCGIKLLSDIVTHHGSPGFFCSLIKREMILGKYIRCQVSQEGVQIFYKEESLKQRRIVFQALIENRHIDIYYPFVHLSKEDRLEITTPDKGWFITSHRAHLLGIGEKHLRKTTIQLLKESEIPEDTVIYDPACSTGEFLGEIKVYFPQIKTIGQDISLQMCEYAKDKVDEIIYGNSLTPGVAEQSCDYIFLRFLNAEVVSTKLAMDLFINIMKCLKVGGKAVLFGHTPVLIALPMLQKMHYKVISCNAYIPKENAVCQYYVIKKGEYVN